MRVQSYSGCGDASQHVLLWVLALVLSLGVETVHSFTSQSKTTTATRNVLIGGTVAPTPPPQCLLRRPHSFCTDTSRKGKGYSSILPLLLLQDQRKSSSSSSKSEVVSARPPATNNNKRKNAKPSTSQAQRWEKAWDNTYQRLRDYRDQHGNVAVPSKWNEDGQSPHLGRWVQSQRNAHKEGKLRTDRVQRLEDIGCSWHYSIHDEAWDRNYQRLRSYRYDHGNTAVPSKWNEDGQLPQLGQWVQSQRHAHKQGKLREDRIERLQQIGFIWQRSTIVFRWEHPNRSRMWEI